MKDEGTLQKCCELQKWKTRSGQRFFTEKVDTSIVTTVNFNKTFIKTVVNTRQISIRWKNANKNAHYECEMEEHKNSMKKR